MATLPLPSYRVRVAPEILVWARESAGLSQDEARRVANVSMERLQAWETGEETVEPPTVAQLRSLSNIYKRPISLFLLRAAPAERLAATYARRLHGASAEAGSRHLRFAVRDACDQRAIALQLLESLDEDPPELVRVHVLQEDVEGSGRAIREELGVQDDDLLAWARRGQALQSWIDALDQAGVLVVQFKYVEVEERRGFAIIETPLPLIALNELDARAARLFTLLHEFAHILRATNNLSTDDETWCNAVAAATLVPEQLVRAHLEEVGQFDDWWAVGVDLARAFGVSREAAFRRLATLGFITTAQYQQAREELGAEPKSGGRGIVTYPTGEVRRVGRQYIRVVGRAYEQGLISLHAASRYLGVQGQYVEPLVTAAERGARD